MFKKFTKFFLNLYIISCLSYSTALTHSEAYFSPDEHLSDKLIQLINDTKHKIHAAIYMLTDKQIAQALIDANKRGVNVEIIVDRATMDFEYGKGKFLKDNGIEISVYTLPSNNGKSNNFSPIMHNKFAIFDDKIWTGSFNWTQKANRKNQENVIITTNKKVYAKFEKQFEILKNRSTLYHARKSHQKNGDESPWENLWEKFKKVLTSAPA